MSGDEANFTVLVLRDIAEHLARGDVMNVAGEWVPEHRLIDATRPQRRRARRIFEQGRRAATHDAVQALRWVAAANAR